MKERLHMIEKNIKTITRKKFYAVFTSILLVVSIVFSGCTTNQSQEANISQDEQALLTYASESVSEAPQASGIPKYIFLFIGDGMSFPQATALGLYNGTVENNFVGTLDNPTPDNQPQANMPVFIDFPVVGAATTYDASKFITDSASAATAIACGVKTLDGAIGVDPYNNPVTSIAETLKKEAGYKIGIVTSVSIDHATPAGFYAHVPSRNSYYDIALDLVASDFDFFGGGGFKQPTGKDNDKKDIIELAKEAGYTVVNTYDEISALNTSSGKTIAINPVLDSPGDAALNYMIDRSADDFSLSSYVQKAIDVIGEDDSFFIMAEGGKVDWACHANDAYTAIQEVKDLENAVNVAVAFAQRHPKDTLILVTGDHETGGFSMGYGGTKYDTYLSLLQHQQLSFNSFAKEYVQKYREENTPFETAMNDVKELYGLMLPTDPEAAAAQDQSLILTEKEAAKFKEAYEVSMIPYDERDRDQEYKATYTVSEHEPFQIVITHTLNNRAGLAWTTTSHSGLPVAVYAVGAGQEMFSDFYDNTEISGKILELVGLT